MQKGQSIIEIIIALALFVIIVGSSVVAIVGSLSTTRLAEEEAQAATFAMTGMEATQSIRNQDWENLTNGNHGITDSGGAWAFTGTSDDPNGSGKFTRVITIADVERDENGDIATTSGTIDPDSKKITTTVSWDFTPTRSNTVEYIAYLTNWQTSQGSAGVSGACSDAADCLTVNTDSAAANGQELRYIILGNSDPDDPITIDQMRVTWIGGSTTDYIEIKIDGNTVWSDSAASGEQVDITNTSISTNTSSIPLDYIKFDDSIIGATIAIEFTMTDASTKTVSGISL